ncbi:hypothetical protein [Prosthecomicrobium pneumaticum]|uniref:Ribosomal protein L12E/L44/L45/RPP1/RPP2 n=1 Tax=Prosthecomicrobium pneumaticum TaxID=81895 RepID=A0A7W9L415_9HYPH|nr:hypothetical protein [Prosthecomicrobium pneumaticum]MBB5755121.1 ribosomal protein L12E/L44/L45/RPP1/RPP2 [Prosthecomicrobium pneumaticum]
MGYNGRADYAADGRRNGAAAPATPTAAPSFSAAALAFMQNRQEAERMRKAEQEAEQARRAALFGGSKLAGLYG